MNLHPFFINGNPGTLKHLQSIGFKTFDKWWDESYDSELDFKKRVEMTLKEIKSICSKTPTEMIEMIKEMKPTLEYNKNLLKELFVNGEFENKLLTQLYKNKFNMKRVLITGGSGYLGSVITEKLLKIIMKLLYQTI